MTKKTTRLNYLEIGCGLGGAKGGAQVGVEAIRHVGIERGVNFLKDFKRVYSIGLDSERILREGEVYLVRNMERLVGVL